MTFESQGYYDRYWSERDWQRTADRSRERGALALKLLEEGRSRRLLEVGCGPGWALEVLQAGGFKVQGVDISLVAVEEARRRSLEVQQADITTGDFPASDAPEVIVALEVLEHVLDPFQVLKTLCSRLAPGGQVVVSLPNELHIAARLQMLVGRLPFGGHDDPHLRHFDRRQQRRLLKAAGYEVQAAVPVSVLPPRWGVARAPLIPFVHALPGLFSIATLYLLQIGGGGDE